ncbi:T9SS type A sorting domain-containing protein [Gramella sp. MAR_2010_147]|uniref:Ig-like domain-containing protein n=1 Tax=Gramella sp. MAR_2010_147 TaxID=1250205 RepID=UPI00087D6D21|nr:T9SS type A sorting domain-containing protein [Gramella sp. MAR_2010_147]SDS53054.1 Por secretion system C-terminal sorting domain-containing protein [Gramella sp. MAR_2010_147]
MEIITSRMGSAKIPILNEKDREPVVGSVMKQLSKNWSLFLTVAFLLFGYQEALIAQTNIKGLVPVLQPLGGHNIDGNAYVNVNGEPGGDWLFEFGTDPVNKNPGGVFPPSASDGIAEGIPDVPFPDDFYLYPGQTTFFRDNITNNDPTIFTSSNKINDNPNTYTWGTGSSPNKNEIQNAISHFSFADPNLPHGNEGDLWLIFAADRQVTNGSSYIDFEILQKPLTAEPGGTFTSLGTEGGRTLGDILITIEFTNGGGAAKVVTRRWVANGNGFIYEIFTPVMGTIFGTENDVATIVPYSIYFQDPINPAGFYQYSINQWAEGAVNVTSFFPEDACVNLSTLFVRTRTSGNSTQSELKDFPGKPIQITIDLTPPAPQLTDVSACDLWDDTLIAEGCEGTVNWYAQEEGGSSIHTGANFSPGEITETTSYWASCTVNECEGPRAKVTITIYDSPAIEIGSTDISCFGEDDGVVSIASASGYDLLELYQVNNEGDDNFIDSNTDGSNFTGLGPGEYYVVASLEAEAELTCSTTSNTVEIEEPPLLELVLDDVIDVNCFGFADGAISITASGGTGAYTYDWEDIEGDDNVEDRSGLIAGSYSVTVTDDNGCTASLNDIMVAEPTELMAQVDEVTHVSCFGFSDGAIDISVSGGTPPYSYDWDDIAEENEPEDRTGLFAGTYSVIITDDNGCEVSLDDILVDEPTELTAQVDNIVDATCSGFENGEIYISASGGTPPYTYDWADLEGDDNVEDRIGVAAGFYSVVITDANGCTTELEDIELEDPSDLEAQVDSVEDVSCFGFSDGAINISVSGGTPPYTYNWDDLEGDDNPEDRTGITAGSYSVTITDDNGCIYSLNDILVNEPPALQGEVSDSMNPTCFGFTDGFIDITISGGTPPYTYDWADLEGDNNPADRTNIGGGSYNVTATDANGCEFKLENIMLDEPLKLMVDLVPTPESCEFNDGVITVNASGGTSPYEFSLDGVSYQLSNMFDGLAAGNYTVYTRDANECISQDPVAIDPPENCIVDEGCTLGYWKNHTDRWCDAYATCDTYGDIYIDAPAAIASLSLLEVLNIGGGDIYNLGRQSVAALLNTCSIEVGFTYSSVESLISDVNDAFANGEAGSFGTYLDGLNQAGCPLGGSSATTAPTSPECDAPAASLLADVASSGFSVSPVPFGDQVSVKYHFDYTSNVNIQFFNLSGQMLQNFKFKGVSTGDINDLNVGAFVRSGQAYIIKVNTDRESFSKTIISSE